MRERPWMCWRCGYFMDANTCVTTRNAKPSDGDISMCLNCGALYTRHSETWKPTTSIELATVNAATKTTLDRMRTERARVVKGDLTKQKELPDA